MGESQQQPAYPDLGRGRQHFAKSDSYRDLRSQRAARHLQRADQPLQRVVHAGADVRAAEARLRNQSTGHHRHLGRLTAAWRPAAARPVAIVCRMAADLLPICLSLTDGDRYTVWAPRWRDAGDEWEAFLGKDEDLFVFETPADLVAFVRTNTDNDLVDHPAWKGLTEANAHKLEPADDKQFDLIAVEELVSEKPTEKSVAALANALAIVSSIGSVCELPAVMKFFNGNPTLGTLSGGIGHFTGKAGLKRWNVIAEVIGRSGDDVLGALDEIISAPDVDSAVSDAAAAELAEPVEEEHLEEEDSGTHQESDAGTEEQETGSAAETVDDGEKARAGAHEIVLGGDEDFWLKVGIDPI